MKYHPGDIQRVKVLPAVVASELMSMCYEWEMV